MTSSAGAGGDVTTTTTRTTRHHVDAVVAGAGPTDGHQQARSLLLHRQGAGLLRVDEEADARDDHAPAGPARVQAALQDDAMAAPARLLLHRAVQSALPVPAGHGARQD